jgi:type I restriction enzyme S subunit
MKLRKDKWEIAELNKIVHVVNGSTPQEIETAYNSGEFPFLRVSDMNLKGNEIYINKWNISLSQDDINKFKVKLYPKNTIIFPKRGASIHTNKKRILQTDCGIDLNTMGFIAGDKIDFYYLFTWFQTIDLKTISDGSYIPQINSRNIEGISIPLPPLEEQKQIAALFQSIETAIEQVDGQEKNLLDLKNKLLKALFSDKKGFGNHLTTKDFETIRFDKIAINISERVEPKKTELTTYVGLEHLDADNLKIERTGTPDDVIGTKLKIYKGDIIFGKRRAYLRKVAVSHFDGIASAHSMILRANEKNIEKEFLPYFMQSDTFMSRAVQISEGSLSPTIKAKTLAQQEFILPKKEKQKELISVFKQFDTTMEQLKQQRTTLKNLKQKLLNEILGSNK